MELNIEKNFERYINLIKTKITRDSKGVEQLVAYLKSKDTAKAPASTRYHLSVAGGLVAHSLNVYDRLNRLIAMEFPDNTCPYSEETIAIVALLHDISKVNFYEVQERNAKDASGNWIKVPFYQVKDEDSRLIFGSHSMNSYYMVNTFIPLSYEESLAILYHMGGLDTTEDSLTAKNLSEAYKKSRLAMLLHFADMLSTFADESNEGFRNE